MRAVSGLLALALIAAGCGNGQQTTTAPTTVSAPTATETFAGSLPVGGSSFYSFVVSANGTVNVTLVSLSGTAGADGVDVDATAALGLAIGTPSGTGCSGGSVTNAPVGTDPQVSSTFGPGRYCVDVSDVGNLVTPATFVVTIAHP